MIYIWPGAAAQSEFLALKQESRILGQWSNLVSGSRKNQASSPWAKQQCLTCSVMEKPHTGLDECKRIILSCFRARNSVQDVAGVLPDSRRRLRGRLLVRHEDLQLLDATRCAPGISTKSINTERPIWLVTTFYRMVQQIEHYLLLTSKQKFVT